MSADEAPLDSLPTLFVDAELSLTAPVWEDRAAHLRHLNATPQIHHYLRSIPFPYTEADADDWLRTAMTRRYADCKEADWTMRLSTGEAVGECWLLGIEHGARAEIGYWVAPDYWGRGLAARAVRTLARHAFSEFDCWKVFATVREGNLASCRVLEKAGFAWEATLQRHAVHDGRAWDVLCYGLWRD